MVTGPAQPGPRTPRPWSPSPSAGGGELALKPGPGADPADGQLPSGSFPTLRGRARVYSRGRLAACRWPAGVAGVAGVAVGLQPSASASAAATSRAGRKSPRQGTSTVGGWRCCSLPRPGGQAGPRRGQRKRGGLGRRRHERAASAWEATLAAPALPDGDGRRVLFPPEPVTWQQR